MFLIFTVAVAVVTGVSFFIALSTGPLLAPSGELRSASIANACGTTELASRCSGHRPSSAERMAAANDSLAQGT